MLEIYQGENRDIQVEVYTEDGELADLAGYTIRWRMAPVIEPFIIEKTAVVISEGVVRVSLMSSDTYRPTGLYIHELRAEDPDGNIQSIYQGEITIHRSLFKNESLP